jgi:hypothetical protein
MAVTVRQLFDRIAGKGGAITKDRVKQFVESAGVKDGFLVPKASLAAGAVMDKFDDGSGAVSWDRFRQRSVAMVPPALIGSLDQATVAKEVDARWRELDPKGRGAVDERTLANFLTVQLEAKGLAFAGTKAEAGARVLMHALDADGDHLLQKDELEGFLQDAVTQAQV